MNRKGQNINARGVALMPLVLVFSGLVVAVGLTFSTISISHGIAVESEYGASRALHYAEAGLNDALLRLARNKNYLCDTDDCYTIQFSAGGCVDGRACALISVKAGASTTHERIVVSRGQFGLNARVLERNFFFDNNLGGLISGATWCERERDVDPSPLCPAQ